MQVRGLTRKLISFVEKPGSKLLLLSPSFLPSGEPWTPEQLVKAGFRKPESGVSSGGREAELLCWGGGKVSG